MTGQGHLLIADLRKSARAPDVQSLIAKLQRRGFWTTLVNPGAPLPEGAAGLAAMLDHAAISSQALQTISRQAQSAGIPVVAWLDGAEQSGARDHLPASVILVHGHDASRDRALSRFANTIVSAGVEANGIEPPSGTGQLSREPASTVPGGAVWSWPGALLGPLWPVAAGRPLKGFLGLALLIAGTVAGASLAQSPLAPLVGFAAAWLAFAVLMGLFAGEHTPGEGDERWFRPVGALALAVVVGFVALVGWSKAQSERASLQPQLAGTTGNPVVVGRRASGWTWDDVWNPIGMLPIDLGGKPTPGIIDDPIDPPTGPDVPLPPPTDDRESCAKLAEQNGGKQSDSIADIIFCGDQDGTPPS